MQLTTELVHNGGAGTAPHNFFLPSCKKMKRQTADKSAWRQIARQAWRVFEEVEFPAKPASKRCRWTTLILWASVRAERRLKCTLQDFSTLSEPLLTTVPLNQGRINLGQSCNGFFWNTTFFVHSPAKIFLIMLILGHWGHSAIKERKTFQDQIFIRIIIGGIINW